MKVMDYFDGAFLLTIAKDINLRAIPTMRRLGGAGVTGFELWIAEEPTDRGPFKTLGARGCTEAHLDMVAAAKARRWDSVLIIEDDAVPRPDLIPTWATLRPALDGVPWDLLYFYSRSSFHLDDEDPRLVRTNGELNGHFYAVHSRFYDRFAEVIRGQWGTIQDVPLASCGAYVVAAHPPLVGQHAGWSKTMEVDRPDRMTPGVDGMIRAW